jgi:bacillopeptidase F
MPASVGPALANSGVNCFGTNIAANYALNANISLRSSPIDLTNAGGATLNYAEWRDIEEGFDFGTVAVLDAADDSELAVVRATVDGFSLDWEGISVKLPSAALGHTIRLEFRFQSDDISNFAGWYVDDVGVTVP